MYKRQVPAGVFDRFKDEATGRTLVDPQSFHYVEPTPVGFWDVFASVPKGMIEAAEVIFFIFVVGGAFTIIQATGAIDAGISKIVLMLKGREKLLIPVTMFVFSLGGLSFGMSEETIVFIPMGVALATAVGFDPLVGTAIISTGAAVGFAGGILNPFTVGVAQSISELPLFSGIWLRIVGFAVLFIVACYYAVSYTHLDVYKRQSSTWSHYDKSLRSRRGRRPWLSAWSGRWKSHIGACGNVNGRLHIQSVA